MAPSKIWGLPVGFICHIFKPTIDFNMLQYISSSDSQVSDLSQVSNHFNDLLAGLLVDFNNLIILKGSKLTMHAIFKHSYTCTYGHTHVHTDMLHYVQIQGENLAAEQFG